MAALVAAVALRFQFARGLGHVLLFRDGDEDAKLFQCHEPLSDQFDQGQAETRDEQEGEGTEQSGPQASGCQLADVSLQPHRRQGNGQQERGRRRNPDFCLGRNGDQAVDADQRHKAEYEPRHRRSRR